MGGAAPDGVELTIPSVMVSDVDGATIIAGLPATADITANDPNGWDNPEGVPTVHLYPADDGSRVATDFISYHGAPAADEIELFMAANGAKWGAVGGKDEL